MMKKRMIAVIAATAAIGLSACAFASETEAQSDEVLEAYVIGPDNAPGRTTAEIEQGILTIRIEDSGYEKDGFSWGVDRGDKGDASLVECITETDMEEGLAYAGTFKAVEDSDNGSDTIRILHSNGHYTDQYMEFTVRVENGLIVERTGGGYAFPAEDEALASVLEGVWQDADDGSMFMNIALAEDGGLAVEIMDGSGEKTFTMTAFHDCVKDVLVYWDGVSFGEEKTETAQETMTEEIMEEETGEKGYLLVSAEDEEMKDITVEWVQDPEKGGESHLFVKAE